jgi:hypothetical protein
VLRRAWRGAAILIAGVGLVVAAVWVVANSKSGLQNALIAVGAIITALATAWATYRATRSEDPLDSGEARVALGLHMRAWPHVHLFRTPGREGDPWMWVVTLGQGKEAARLELQWNVGGRPCTTSLDRLDAGQVWTHPSYLEPSIQAVDIRNQLGSVSIEWEDAAHYLRWRSLVEIAPGSSRGTPMPDGDTVRFVESDVPFVNNGEPEPLR